MKNLLKLLTLLCIVLGICSCKQQKAENHGNEPQAQKAMRTVSADEFEQIIADSVNVTVLDVRTQEEYDAGHLKNAQVIDVKKDSFRDECIKQLSKDKVIAVYCRSGFRSKTASNILMEDGFEVVNLDGGFNGWTAAGKEVVK